MKLQLAERIVEGKRLGRHINHDPRSLQFLVPETDNPQSAEWELRIPILDQGNLGSCTGNALTALLGTDVNYEKLPSDVQANLNETFAVTAYEQGTREDDYPGQYPPDDTGCDGLTLAKVAKENGWTPGYTHATSLAACHNAIKIGPFMTGVSWYSGMDNPNSEGIVKVTGYVRGGHEFAVLGYDAAKGLWKCPNSWGTGFGKDGYFYFSDEDYDKLLKAQGDATQILPLDEEPPTPTPPAPPNGFPLDTYEKWKQHFIKYHHQLETAVDAWLASGGK